MLFNFRLLSFAVFVGGFVLHEVTTECPKNQVLLHNIKPEYYMDMGENIEVWVKNVQDPWQDNRLIGGVNDPSALSFNLSCVQQASDFKGVVARNMTAVIFQRVPGFSNSIRSNTTGEFEFYIKAFSENDECDTVQVNTKITVGCPVHRRLQIHGQKFEGCDEFKNYNYTISREQLNGNSSKVVNYDFKNLGCPITSVINKHFKPTVHMYDDDKFVAEITDDFIMWEKHGRNSYHYSMTMQQAGCVSVPENWNEMVESLKVPNIDQENKQQIFHRCFDLNESKTDGFNLNMAYQISNHTGGSALIWDDGGIYAFRLRIIDPRSSFCDLTVEFAVNVGPTQPGPESVPTFVVLGASCFGIILGTVAAYYIDSYCF